MRRAPRALLAAALVAALLAPAAWGVIPDAQKITNALTASKMSSTALTSDSPSGLPPSSTNIRTRAPVTTSPPATTSNAMALRMVTGPKARRRKRGSRSGDKDPIASVERIYAHFELPFTATARGRMQRHLDENPRDAHGVHEYSLDDFGIDAGAAARRFRPYCERFGLVPRPPPRVRPPVLAPAPTRR